jgi:hypothetical protein
MSTNGPRFAIRQERVTRHNQHAVDEFAQLANVSRQRKLKASEAKRFARLQTQLMRSGTVTLLTKELVTQQARMIYRSLPWWHKLALRVRFYWRITGARFEVLRLKLRLRSPWG